MQVIVLDRHAPADARIDRHCGTLLRNDIKTVRIRVSRPGENSDCDDRFLQKERMIDLVPLNQLPLPLQKISQHILYFLPAFMHRIYPFDTLIGMNEEEETIIHVHDPDLLGMASRIKKIRFTEAKIVYDRHEVFERAGGLYGFVSSIFEKLHARNVQGVVGIARIYEEGNKKIFSHADVTSVPNYPLFSEYDHLAVQSKIDCFNDDSDILLSYIGSLNHHYDRDVFLLLELMEQVLERVPKTRVFIGGKTESKELKVRIAGLIEKYGERFQYPGYVSREKTLEITQNSHLGFFLLKPESNYWVKSSPNKFYEYLVTGNVAIVRADIDAELPSDSVMMFDRWTADDNIISDVLSLVQEPKKVQHMMQSAYHQGSRFTYESVESNYLKMYRSLFDEL